MQPPRPIAALAHLPHNLNQMDMFGASCTAGAPYLPEARVNDVGVLVDGVLVRIFRNGRDRVEIRIGQHQGWFYKSVCVEICTEYSGYSPALKGACHPDFAACWSAALEEARTQVHAMISVVRSHNEEARGKRAGVLLGLINTGTFQDEGVKHA